MNKESSKTNEKKGNLPDNQPPAESVKLASNPKVDKKKKDTEVLHLPVLVELAYTISAIVVIIASLTVVITSLVMGASLIDLVIRTSVTTLTIGGLLTLVSWQISAGALKASLAEQEEELQKAKTAQEKLDRPGVLVEQETMSDNLFEAQ
ncbi:MAG: hypothetical protein NTW32_03950 [Chloroflexi bacterium]|nr:hypothetical protein [Chloroflexota bacterium]